MNLMYSIRDNNNNSTTTHLLGGGSTVTLNLEANSFGLTNFPIKARTTITDFYTCFKDNLFH
jgi:hypothetical protein